MRILRIQAGLANISGERRCFLYFRLRTRNCEKTRAISADMSILNYFKWKKKEASLPEPKGPLSDEVPSATIAEANREVLKVLSNGGIVKKNARSTYIKVDGDYKAIVAKYALEHGNCAAARKYSSELKENLNESTVRSWVTKYKEEWSKKRER